MGYVCRAREIGGDAFAAVRWQSRGRAPLPLHAARSVHQDVRSRRAQQRAVRTHLSGRCHRVLRAAGRRPHAARASRGGPGAPGEPARAARLPALQPGGRVLRAARRAHGARRTRHRSHRSL